VKIIDIDVKYILLFIAYKKIYMVDAVIVVDLLFVFNIKIET